MIAADSKNRNLFIILILGALTTVSPFAIDLYLPAFPQIAEALGTTVARVALSLSSYFIGLAIGQIFYGPVLDRYGRKRPVYFGLGLFVLTSIGCLFAKSVDALIALRFLQALGGCAAQVAAMAMVRDFFPVKEGAKVFSFMVLILGVSPLLAPTIGGLVTTALGWQWIFILLAAIVFLILVVTYFFLPEGHQPDPTISLRPKPILLNFVSIFKHPQFHTYALAATFSFSGLLVYVTGSPIIFMDVFQLSAKSYGAVFALLSIGFIGASQVNILLSRKFSNRQIFKYALAAQCTIGICFLISTLNGWNGLVGTIAFIFLLLFCLGLINPNGSALALAPFAKNAGSASALLGSMQIGIAALASTGVGLFESKSILPTVAILAVTATLGLTTLLIGERANSGSLA